MSDSRLNQRKSEYTNVLKRLDDVLKQPINEYIRDANHPALRIYV